MTFIYVVTELRKKSHEAHLHIYIIYMIFTTEGFLEVAIEY